MILSWVSQKYCFKINKEGYVVDSFAVVHIFGHVKRFKRYLTPTIWLV